MSVGFDSFALREERQDWLQAIVVETEEMYEMAPTEDWVDPDQLMSDGGDN